MPTDNYNEKLFAAINNLLMEITKAERTAAVCGGEYRLLSRRWLQVLEARNELAALTPTLETKDETGSTTPEH